MAACCPSSSSVVSSVLSVKPNGFGLVTRIQRVTPAPPGRVAQRRSDQAQLGGLLRLLEARRLNELAERGDRGAARHQERRAQQHQRREGSQADPAVRFSLPGGRAVGSALASEHVKTHGWCQWFWLGRMIFCG